MTKNRHQDKVGRLERELQAARNDLHDTIGKLEISHSEAANNDLAELLSSMNIAMLFLDNDLRIKCFTRPLGEVLRLTGADIGKSIAELPSIDVNQDLADDARRVLDQLATIEREIVSNDAPRRYFLRRTVPHRATRDQVSGVAIAFFDMTERRRNEEALENRVSSRTAEAQSSRRRMLAIIETAVDAIATIDACGIVELFNPAAERMFGYRSEEVVGQNVKLLMPSPYSSEHDRYLGAYLRTGIKKIIGIGREVVGLRKDGSTFPMDLTVSEFEEYGKRQFVGTIRDLSELKEAQEAVAREHALSEGIVSTARAIILRLDEQGRILSFNPYMEELCGYTLSEVQGSSWFDTFIPDREHDQVRRVFTRAVGGHRTKGMINPIKTKSGDEVLIEWYDNVLEVRGEPFSLIAIGHDVTERDRLEREFLQAQKMEAVGRLAGGVAHDFNNLLAGIAGGLRIALDELDENHPSKEMLDQVQLEVARGSSITRRLLDFSRAGKAKRELIDPRETLLAGERMIQRLIGEDVEVRVDCDGSRSLIQADAGQLEQAVLNLAINARDAMPRGGQLNIRCMDISLSRDEIQRLGAALEPGSFVVVSTEDTGCGMDETTRANALEAFFTTKGPGLGTGLGLSSVATMVEQCSGHLQLSSEVGVGTAVRMYFPRAAEAAIAETAPIAPVTEPAKGQGETILLVEDETLVRLGVQHSLEDMNFVVLAAKDPLVALETLDAHRASIDLLLTDVVLPEMDGPELAARVRDRCPDIRVLFMSAFPAEELIAQGRIVAGELTLEKPFTDDRLASKIREALTGRR